MVSVLFDDRHYCRMSYAVRAVLLDCETIHKSVNQRATLNALPLSSTTIDAIERSERGASWCSRSALVVYHFALECCC